MSKWVKFAIAVLISLFSVAIMGEAVFANDFYWFGEGGGTVSPGSNPGSGGSGCYEGTNQSYKWRVDCTGVSWAYYGSEELTSESVEFPFVAVAGGVRGVRIPAQCSGEGGGFWHFGINSHGAFVLNGQVATGSGGYYGHWTTVPWSYAATSWVQYNTSSGTPLQTLGPYTLYKYGDESDVLADYNAARAVAGLSPVSGLPANLYAFCYRRGAQYYGRSNVSAGGEWSSTGDVIVSEGGAVTTTTVVYNAGINEDVPVVFSHDIMSTSSATGVSWNVSKDFSNSGIETAGANPANLTVVSGGYYYAASRPGSDGSNNYIRRDQYTVKYASAGTYTLCETLSVNGNATTRACARIVVTATPPPPSGTCDAWTPASYTNSTSTSGTTSVVTKVQNKTLSTGWNDKVLAKPTDNITWIHCYYPGVQRVAKTLATGYMVISPGTGNHASHDSSLGSGGTTANSYSEVQALHGSWGNSFNVTSTRLRNPNPNSGSYLAGDSNIKTLIDDTYAVEYGGTKNKAGWTLRETIRSSTPTTARVLSDGRHSWDCDYGESCSICGSYDCNCTTEEVCSGEGENESCSSVTTCDTCCYSCYRSTCQHSNDYIKAYWNSIFASDYAEVEVPYNFINTATVSIGGSYVYAGETASIAAMDTQVRTRTNNTLQGTYATHVSGAKVKLVAYLSTSNTGTAKRGVGSGKSYEICDALKDNGYEECDELSSADGITLNASGALRLGYPEGTLAATDSVLGKVGSGPYNVYDARAGKYYCVVAAVYPYTTASDKDMKVSESDLSWYVSAPSCAVISKRPSMEVWGGNLYSAGAVALEPGTKRVVDGVYGWTEKSVSDTTVFGSWVELGIVSNGKISGLASGASTASFGNTSRTPVSGLGGSKEGSGVSDCTRSPLTVPNNPCSDMKGITVVSPGGSSGSSISGPNDKAALIARFASGDTPGVQYDNNTVSGLGNTVVTKGTTRVIRYDGTFRINENITYEDGYVTLLDIPKLIIYANNIEIACDVTRIDAVLIADNNVNTCPTISNDYSQAANSVQLKINGAIITDTLTMNRTYGAATGKNSTVPAEIVDYDTSLYLWGAPRADSNVSGKLETVYLKEVAPRY